MDQAAPTRRQTAVLVVSVFAAGLCSIVYELLIGTASSYFLGDSIRQFSLTIGLFMASMGVGSLLSRYLGDRLLEVFVAVELALAVLGGLAIPALYASYALTELYQPSMFVLIGLIGTLTGLEIPVLVLLVRKWYPLRTNLSNVLSLDYFGALAATLLFPFVLLPTLGTFRASLATGMLNLAVALLVVAVFPGRLSQSRRRIANLVGWLAGAGLLALFIASPYLLKPWHQAVYEDRVIYIEQTEYQKVVLTRSRDDMRLFLDGNLQFSTVDEYRYHESLVHPAMSLAPHRSNVLMLGGGDGLGLREVLAYPEVEAVTLVDLDPAVTNLGKNHSHLRELNRDSMSDPRVTIVNTDAFIFLEQGSELYDVIIADLPDPNNVSLARLYSREFFGRVARRLAKSGIFVTQSTSPFFAKEAFWTISVLIAATELKTLPYHAYVPSFGDWGFVVAARHRLRPEDIDIVPQTRFLDDETVPRLFVFERDLRKGEADVSTLDDPKVLSRYLAGWKHWD